MHTLPWLVANRYQRPMTVGRTAPCLFDCRLANGTVESYVVKFYGPLTTGIIGEYFAAVLGTLLDLPIPPAAIVEIDRRIAELLPETHRPYLEQGPHFGSKHIAEATMGYSGSYAIPRELTEQAIDIYVWDMLIQNPDRRVENSNMFLVANQFVIFDHELALQFGNLLGPVPSPWELKNLPFAKTHVLFNQLRSKIDSSSFDPFLERFSRIPIQQLEEIASNMPESWFETRSVSKIIAHFRSIHDNLDRFRRGLLEVFS